jgi:hypothetical protein
MKRTWAETPQLLARLEPHLKRYKSCIEEVLWPLTKIGEHLKRPPDAVSSVLSAHVAGKKKKKNYDYYLIII